MATRTRRASAQASPRVSVRGLAEAVTGLAVPLMYLSFAYAHLGGLFNTGRVSLGVMVAFETVVAFSYVFRRTAVQLSASMQDRITTTLGTLLPLLLRPTAARSDVPAGEGLQLVGALLCMWGILALNRRFGLLPANRGICTSGPYRYVRHPLYSAYWILQVGYLISNLTSWNAVIVATASASQVFRIVAEERLLLNDAAYRAYSMRTPWRVLPFVY